MNRTRLPINNNTTTLSTLSTLSTLTVIASRPQSHAPGHLREASRHILTALD